MTAKALQAHADATVELSQTKAEVERWRKDLGELRDVINGECLPSWIAVAPSPTVFCLLMRLPGVC